MRKFLIMGLFASVCNIASSQDDGSIRNLRFGLKVTPSINWFKPEGKLVTSDGPVLRYGGGLVLEYRLAKIISVQSGLQIDIAGGKSNYNNGSTLFMPSSHWVSYYYNTVDEKMVKYDTSLDSKSHKHYQLNQRSYNFTYVTIPLTLKMKTKEIGSLTYYGQFGINNSFRWKSLANDNLQVITNSGLGTTDTKSKVDVTKDVSLYTASLNMGLGAEYNLSGSTSLTFGLNYNLGFTNVVKGKSDYLYKIATDDTGAIVAPGAAPLSQEIKLNSISLLIGVLF